MHPRAIGALGHVTAYIELPSVTTCLVGHGRVFNVASALSRVLCNDTSGRDWQCAGARSPGTVHVFP